MVNLFYFYKLHIVYFILYLYIILNLILQIDVIVLCIGKKTKDPHTSHYCYFSYFFSGIYLRSVIYNTYILFNNILKFELLI